MESKPLEIGHHALSRRAISCSATWRSMTAVPRGIAEFLPEPDKYLRKPDIAIVMDGAAWAQLYLNQTDLRSAVEGSSAKITTGDLESAVAVLDLFDKFEPAKNVTVQTLNLHDCELVDRGSGMSASGT
jgi:hypothetical protein